MQMKKWLIKASAPFCGTDTYYRAYSEQDPLEACPEIWDEIVEELWDNYSYLLHLEDEEFDSDEEYEEAYDQAYENWKEDCSIYAEEATDEDFEMNAPGGDLDALEIKYDERNEK